MPQEQTQTNIFSLYPGDRAALEQQLPENMISNLTRFLGQHIDGEDQLTNVLWLMAQQRIGNRPGRIESLTVKRRPKPYALLMERRCFSRG
jgi:hypothetical protein